VLVRIERVGDTTRYARIVSLMEQAAAERPALARAADRIASPFLWFVLLAAVGAAAAWWAIDPARSIPVAVAVLIVTCPCALSLATPAALLAAAGTLARRGILLQRLQALETLAAVRRIVFDKTGTLTQDGLALSGIEPEAPWSREEALRHALALASASLHPVAKALCAQAGEVEAVRMQDVRETPGQGLEGTDGSGRRWRLGASAFAVPRQASTRRDAMASWLSCDGEAVAVFLFDESLKPDARQAIAALHEDGLHTSLYSGDRSESVERLAGTLGIVDFRSQALPEDKLDLVALAQQRGERVAMVGDGMNDGPVLARADVSLAMGQGAALARAQADFILLGGRATDVVLARRLAVRTMRVVRQNLAWAAVYNAVCIPLALAGWLPPWLAGLGMASSSLLVVLNAQRLRRVEAEA
jgi:Cu2+-exporting ATPase